MERHFPQEIEAAYKDAVWRGESEQDLPEIISCMTGGKIPNREIVNFLNSSRASEIVDELKEKALKEIRLNVFDAVDHALSIGITKCEDIEIYTVNSIGIDGRVDLIGGPRRVFDEVDLYLNSLKSE